MNRVCVAYNIFDGIENLSASVGCIRPIADAIIGVYQNVSNHGQQAPDDIEPLLKELGFDAIIHYTPIQNARPAVNELAKRNIGLEWAEQNGFDLFMTMDCDESYNVGQLTSALEKFIQSGCDASSCQMQTYYFSFPYVYLAPETYHVPLFYKTGLGRKFKEFIEWPVVADPTRKLPSKKVLVFPRSEIQMHHFSYVRKNLRVKLENSSARKNYESNIDEMVERYENWKPGQNALTVHGDVPLIDVRDLNIPLPLVSPEQCRTGFHNL